MLFDVEADLGTTIIAYVVPDSGGTTPSVRLRANGTVLLTLAANDRRQNLIDAGRHATGQCGFVIDETLVPGLASFADLEITETSNNILIYRRRPAQAIESTIFRLETHLLPLWRLDEALRDRFHYWCYGIDRFGRETSTQVFCLKTASRYVSGRLLFKNYEYQLMNGIMTVGLIRDPFHELAERLLLLKSLGANADKILGSRDALTFAPVIAAVQDVDLGDDTACKRFFNRAPLDVVTALSNPLVRQLTTATPDEMPGNSSVAVALDVLAGFEVLGLRADAGAFSQAFADLVGMDRLALPSVEEYPRIHTFGERLRSIPAIEEFIEKDLEVFHLITHAFKAAEA